MLIESVELTLTHVGLGTLTEPVLMSLFANAHSHEITAGTGASIRDITDPAGRVLYPGYYWTHLKVPPHRLLSRYRVWDRLSVGVHVRAFGRMMLDSSYIVADEGQVPDRIDAWGAGEYPIMEGSNLFTIDENQAEPQAAAPKAGTVSPLPSLDRPPASMDRFRTVRSTGLIAPAPESNAMFRSRVAYPVAEGRDAAPGHNVAFFGYATILDRAEWVALARRIHPAFSPGLLECRQLLDREIFYLEGCRAGGTVEVEVAGRFEASIPSSETPRGECVEAGILSTDSWMYSRKSNRLLVVARTRKVVQVSRARPGLLREAERLIVGLAARERDRWTPEA
jgi:probable biosynthetic protein (TIGR04098 family)